MGRLTRASPVFDVLREVERKYGQAQARRLQRAGDEGVNLDLWDPKSLSDVMGSSKLYSGSKMQNSGLLMAMHPSEFESFARPIMQPDAIPYNRWHGGDPNNPRPDHSLDDYLAGLTKMTGKYGLREPGQLWLREGNPNIAGDKASVDGHEARHRMRMLARMNEGRALVNIRPARGGDLVGEPDEVVERLIRTYFPQGTGTEFVPEPTGFAGGERAAREFNQPAFGGGGYNDVEDRYSIPNSSFTAPSGSSDGEMPTAEFGLGRGRGSAGLKYDPTQQVIEALLGYKHPLGSRGATVGGQFNYDKYIGPGGNEAKPNLGGALRLTLPFAEGGEVPGYKTRGRVEAVRNLATSLGDAVEQAERRVRAHTQATGNEGMMFGHIGADSFDNSELVKGTKTNVPMPSWTDRFVSSNKEQPWFGLHSHPNDSISPSMDDYRVWGQNFGDPLAMIDDQYGRPFGNMLIAREPSGGLLRIGSVDSGGDMPHTLRSAVMQSKANMEDRWRQARADDPVFSNYLDFMKAHGLGDPRTDKEPHPMLGRQLREMDAGALLNNIAARDVPVQLDASTMLTGTNAPLADVWSELAKIAAKKGEMAEGGTVQHFGGRENQLVKRGMSALASVQKRMEAEAAAKAATPSLSSNFNAFNKFVNPTPDPNANPFIAANRFIASPTPQTWGPSTNATSDLASFLQNQSSPDPALAWMVNNHLASPNIQSQAAQSMADKLDTVRRTHGQKGALRLTDAADLGVDLSLFNAEALQRALGWDIRKQQAPDVGNLLTIIDPKDFQKFSARIPQRALQDPNYKTAAHFSFIDREHGSLDDVLEKYAEAGRQGLWDEVPLLGFGNTAEHGFLDLGGMPTVNKYPTVVEHNGRHRMMTMAEKMAHDKALVSVKPSDLAANRLGYHNSPLNPEGGLNEFRRVMNSQAGKVLPETEWYDPLYSRNLTEDTLPQFKFPWLAEGGAVPGYRAGGALRNYRIGGFGEIDYPTDDSEDAGALTQAGWKTDAANKMLELEKRLNAAREAKSPRIVLPPKPRLQTVKDPYRTEFPGAYKDPDDIVSDVNRVFIPEGENMQRLFHVNRGDLDDISQGRDYSHLEGVPHAFDAPPGGKGSKVSEQVLTNRNMQRYLDIYNEVLKNPDLLRTRSWYEMQPLWDRMKELGVPLDQMQLFNARLGLHSAGANPISEINRGTLANKLITEGRLDDYLMFGGRGMTDTPLRSGEIRTSRFNTPGFPEDMLDMKSHAFHPLHGLMLENLEREGKLATDTHKIPTYIQATDPVLADPRRPIADSHIARGAGYSDVRTGGPASRYAELTNPEFADFAPWWAKASGKAGEQPRDFQALMWNVLGPQTGVDYVGTPKLEMLADQIMKTARRLGVSPETARDLVLTGKAGAYQEGGQVNNFDDGGRMTMTPEQRKILREMRLRQSNERLDVQADKSRMVAGILGDMASEGVGNEWDRFSHNAKGNPLMYGIDAFNRATAGMSGGEALEDTVNMLNPNPNLTAEYGPVAAPADLAAITMGTALTPSRLLGSGIRTAIKSMEKRIPGALAKLAITGGAPTAAKVGMDNLGYDYAGGGGVQSGSQSTGSTSDLLNNNALLEWVRRMIPNAVDIYGNTPSEGAMQPRPKPVELLQSMNRSAPSGGESGGVSAAGIGSMLGGLGKIAGAFGGAGGATAAGSGMGFAHGGYVEPEDRHQRLGAPTIDDEMMAYGVMNYADGGYVPGFSMGGGNLFDPNKWDRETGGGGLGGDLFNLLNSDPRFAAALSSANGTDSSGMGTSAAAPAPAPAETGGGGFGGIINTLAGGDGGVGGLLPMLLKGLGVGGGGGKSGGMDIASLLSPAMAIGKGTGLFAEGGYVPGFADGGMMSGLLGDPSQTQAMYAEWLKTHPPMDPNTPGFGQATPDDFGNGQQYGIPPTGQQGLGAMPQAASMPAAPMASTPSGPGQGVLANMAAASGLQQSTAMGGGRGALSGGDQPMRGSINIQGSF